MENAERFPKLFILHYPFSRYKECPMKYIYSVVVLLIALLLAAFIQQNGMSVYLHYFGWNSPELPLSLYIILAFVAGYLIAVIVGLTSGIRFRIRTAGAEREVKKLKAELQEVRGKQASQSGKPEGAGQTDNTPPTQSMPGAETSTPGTEENIRAEPSPLKGVTADELRNALEDDEETDSWDEHVEEK